VKLTKSWDSSNSSTICLKEQNIDPNNNIGNKQMNRMKYEIDDNKNTNL